MKFTPEVIAALETLRKNAENDFELHRISVLEKDLIAPPVVEIIDDTHQKFNGFVYYKNKSKHYGRTMSLHRAVYTYYYGKIPNGHDVHHSNLDPSDNDVANLICLTKAEHAAAHSKFSKKRQCPECKKIFVRNHSRQIFCSLSCLAKNRNKRKNKPIIRNCPICGKEFTPTHNKRQIFCSCACAAKNRIKKSSEKTCPICMKKFSSVWGHQKYCSSNCRRKAYYRRKKNHN